MAARLFLVAAISLVAHQCSAAIFNPRNSRAGELAKLDWWEKTVFYQIYPKSFMDSNGDGIGDLQGVISKLDHLKDLGIGATWLSPIMKSPQKDGGYDVSDFYDIDPMFGTLADFDDLVKKADALGIKIIMDFVPNHSSDQNQWFKDSVDKKNGREDWYIWEDPIWSADGLTPSPPNNWVSVFRKSAWEYVPARRQYYLHQFEVTQPDFNYRNPALVEEMKNVLRFWLKRGVGGFRIDAINHMFEVDKNLPEFGGKYPDEPLTGYPNQGPDDYGYVDHIYTKDQIETVWMVYEWRKIFEEYSTTFTRVMMTEAYTDIKETMKYYGNGTSEGSHMPFNFGLINNADEHSSAQDIKFATDRWLTYMPLGKTANWVIGNHDQSRVATRYGSERIDGLNMLVTLLPGAAITYNGEEIGMNNTFVSWEDTQDPQACNTDDEENYWKSSRDPARTPIHWDNTANAGFTKGPKTWLPINPNYVDINVKTEKAAERSHYNIYKNLVNLRSNETISHGKYQSVALNDDVFAFVRSLEDHDSYVVVINMAGTEQTIDLNYFSGIAEELTVVEASIHSKKKLASTVKSKALELVGYESIVLRSSAASLTAGIAIVITALFVRLFQ